MEDFNAHIGTDTKKMEGCDWKAWSSGFEREWKVSVVATDSAS